MDKLADQLRDDANRIECRVSGQLDERIRASLEGIEPQPQTTPRRGPRTPAFWWASSLTGAAAAAILIVIINSLPPEPSPAVTEPPPQTFVIPAINWQAETAVLISPLEEEYEDLQSDLEKAEDALRQDIERLF